MTSMMPMGPGGLPQKPMRQRPQRHLGAMSGGLLGGMQMPPPPMPQGQPWGGGQGMNGAQQPSQYLQGGMNQAMPYPAQPAPTQQSMMTGPFGGSQPFQGWGGGQLPADYGANTMQNGPMQHPMMNGMGAPKPPGMRPNVPMGNPFGPKMQQPMHPMQNGMGQPRPPMQQSMQFNGIRDGSYR